MHRSPQLRLSETPLFPAAAALWALKDFLLRHELSTSRCLFYSLPKGQASAGMRAFLSDVKQELQCAEADLGVLAQVGCLWICRAALGETSLDHNSGDTPGPQEIRKCVPEMSIRADLQRSGSL